MLESEQVCPTQVGVPVVPEAPALELLEPLLSSPLGHWPAMHSVPGLHVTQALPAAPQLSGEGVSHVPFTEQHPFGHELELHCEHPLK